MGRFFFSILKQRYRSQIPRKSEVQHLNRIGRRTIMCMLLIVALAVIWNLLGR
jgi:hypothetical protein